MKILIIDDNSLFVDGLSYVLDQLADEVSITACNCVDDAIHILSRRNDFDLILLDLNLPDKDGFAFMQQFQADELCIPVVIFSAETKSSLIKQALDWGAMGFVAKSYSSEEMLAALQAILDGQMFVPLELQSQLLKLNTVESV